MRIRKLTEFAERYNDLVYHQAKDHIFVVGEYALQITDNKFLGYGLIYNFYAPSLWHHDLYTFGGDNSDGSGLNTVVFDNNKFYCGGWTNQNSGPDGIQAWFVVLDSY